MLTFVPTTSLWPIDSIVSVAHEDVSAEDWQLYVHHEILLGVGELRHLGSGGDFAIRLKPMLNSVPNTFR